jgi:hypothetical protein
MRNKYARMRGNHDIDDAIYHAESQWLARFADAVQAIDAKHAGRIEWPAAKHYYFQGLAVDTAAKQYTDNRK